jgi:S1-C subfamily serine protease
MSENVEGEKMKKNVRLLVPMIALIFASLACQVLQPGAAAQPVPPTIAIPTQAPIYVASQSVSQQDALASLYENVMPGIVSIQVLTAQGGAQGTGFAFDNLGHIVTNEHVVDGQQSIEVDFSSGYKAEGKLVGADKDSDLAVIKVDVPAMELHPLALGDSSQLKVGQSVVAIGNPFGLEGSMTLGIVSALGRIQSSNRQLTGGGTFSVADMIQTDAAINPGNSGGPLFNLKGEIIGINRSIRTDASTANGEPVNSGIGFAIPINLVKRVVPAIIKDGKFDYPFMGISTISTDLFSLEVVKALNLKSMTGVYVTNVTAGGPAAKAGLIAGSKSTSLQGILAGGDLIVAVDGQQVKTYDDLIGYLVANKSPGDTITLTVLRGDQKVDLTLTLDKRP